MSHYDNNEMLFTVQTKGQLYKPEWTEEELLQMEGEGLGPGWLGLSYLMVGYSSAPYLAVVLHNPLQRNDHCRRTVVSMLCKQCCLQLRGDAKLNSCLMAR